ncbi:MAG: ABC transporter ATP-binding protein [Sarcina sp.]
MNIIELKNATKIYEDGQIKKIALNNLDLLIEKGEFLGIIGTSGSGKTTLLNVLGLMDKLTLGNYKLEGKEVSGLSENDLSDLRNNKVSFIFQHFVLMSNYNVYDNVELPLSFRKMNKKKEKILNILDELGIKSEIYKYPEQLSGGQKQRVAIARALISESEIILADEPTGALDQKTGKEFMQILKRINKAGKTIILITHDMNLTEHCTRIIQIEDGNIVEI